MKRLLAAGTQLRPYSTAIQFSTDPS
jgi:hypothetical protein